MTKKVGSTSKVIALSPRALFEQASEVEHVEDAVLIAFRLPASSAAHFDIPHITITLLTKADSKKCRRATVCPFLEKCILVGEKNKDENFQFFSCGKCKLYELEIVELGKLNDSMKSFGVVDDAHYYSTGTKKCAGIF